MGNNIAYLIMALWPLVAIYLYRSTSIQVATLWIILGGYMILPVRTDIDFPLIPSLGKHSMPIVSALIGIWLIKGRRVSIRSNYGWVKGLLFIYLISPIITVILNGDRIYIAGRILPELTSHDAISVMISQWLYVLPLLFGRQFFRTYEQQLLMFKTIVIAGLVYSTLILFEIRFSPQLHSWLYGYFPHSFAQQVRQGGFRPVVFMGHGLWVAFFVMVVTLSATVLWKDGVKIRRFSPSIVTIYFFALLILCKSIASLLYGIFALLVVRYVSSKMQLRIAIVLVMLTLLYPTMSILKVFPHQQVVEIAEVFDEDRAGSLLFRFEQESILLDHGAKRFFFGWGGWARNRVFDRETGKDESVTDGRWIITFGQFGWIGFIAEFGLLAMVVFRAYKASKLVKERKELHLLAAHATLVGIVMIDQLPNASLQPWLWLVAGILLGRSEDIIYQKFNEQAA